MHKPHSLGALLQAATRRTLLTLGLVMGLSACIGAARASGTGGDSWQEEVLLHDGQKLIVERYLERGFGGNEAGQPSPGKEQGLRFTLPSSQETVEWKTQFSQDIGRFDFMPLLLDVVGKSAFVVAAPVGCQAYNKWGRPNPPYVVFKYAEKSWSQIPLTELPPELHTPNVIISSPDKTVQRLGTNFVSADVVLGLNKSQSQQQEYKSILRTPLTEIGRHCRVEFSNGRGTWLSADWFSEERDLAACLKVCDRKNFNQATCPCGQLFKGK